MRTITFFALCLLTASLSASCQSDKISTEFKSGAVDRIAELLAANYVFPEKGIDTGEALKKQLKAGVFDTVTSVASFAGMLTKAVQEVTHDKHLRVRLTDANGQPRRPPVEGVGGFKEVKILDGNIGYLDMRGFVRSDVAIPAMIDNMKKLENTKAIIFDLRKNGGGDPNSVQYLCSYFFSERTHLNSLYFRGTGETTDFWTIPVNGKVRADVPIYILTSNYTFSAGEEFCYNMQTRKRATLIGETTGGGANPGGSFPVNDKLTIFISTGRAINPVTGTNWEGVGVVPDIKTTADDALNKALELIAR
jgi:C-terminal processing protease CtpA/Prc